MVPRDNTLLSGGHCGRPTVLGTLADLYSFQTPYADSYAILTKEGWHTIPVGE